LIKAVGITNREMQLTQDLLTLQRQYNELVTVKDKLRQKVRDVESSSALARERLLTILEERDKEIETLKKTLSESRELVELMGKRVKTKASRNEKGT
jgi:predicted RNase H-like nuclease (RuvC/YqgF family)